MLCISFDLLKRVGEAFFVTFCFRQALVIMNFLCLAATVRERGRVCNLSMHERIEQLCKYSSIGVHITAQTSSG